MKALKQTHITLLSLRGMAIVFLSTFLIFQPILVSWALLDYFFGATVFNYIP